MTLDYQEIVDFIAHGSNPADVTRFQPSEKAVARVRELVDRQKDGVATEAEGRELEQALPLEHLMRLAKLNAQLLSNDVS